LHYPCKGIIEAEYKHSFSLENEFKFRRVDYFSPSAINENPSNRWTGVGANEST